MTYRKEEMLKMKSVLPMMQNSIKWKHEIIGISGKLFIITFTPYYVY